MNRRQQQEKQITIKKFFELSSAKITMEEVTRLVNRLHRYETTLRRINDLWCSEDLDDQQQKELEEKEKEIKSNVMEIANVFGFQVHFNDDPRGGAIRFILPDGFSNSFDGTWQLSW